MRSHGHRLSRSKLDDLNVFTPPQDIDTNSFSTERENYPDQRDEYYPQDFKGQDYYRTGQGKGRQSYPDDPYYHTQRSGDQPFDKGSYNQDNRYNGRKFDPKDVGEFLDFAKNIAGLAVGSAKSGGNGGGLGGGLPGVGGILH